MKHTAFTLMLLCIGISAFARDNKQTDKLKTLIGMQPYTTKQEDMKKAFGEPDKIDRGKEQTLWNYKDGDTHLIVCWNTRINRMQKYNLISDKRDETKMPLKNTCRLENGKTGIEQAIDLMGKPKDLFVDADTQRMHYEYKDNVVNLFFKNGVLLHYEVSGKGKIPTT